MKVSDVDVIQLSYPLEEAYDATACMHASGNGNDFAAHKKQRDLSS